MYPTTALKGSDGIKAKVDSKVEKSSVSLLQSYLCIISIINLYNCEHTICRKGQTA